MAVLKFINRKDASKPQTMSELKRLIDYLYRADKTRKELMGGKECIPKTAYDDFELLKKTHNKMDGRLYIHAAISFHEKEDISYGQIKEFADNFFEHPKFENFQVAYAVHTDQPNKHFNFIINSVGLDGEKWRMATYEMQQLKDYSDELCERYKTSVIDKSKARGGAKSMAESKMIEKNFSWKEEMKKAIILAAENSINKNDFMKKLKALGYEVKWTKERERILFVSAEGNSCSDTKLGKAFGKNQIRKMFEDNYKNKDKEEMESKFKKAVDYINEFEKNNRKTLKTVDIDPGQEHMNGVTNTCIYDGIDSGFNFNDIDVLANIDFYYDVDLDDRFIERTENKFFEWTPGYNMALKHLYGNDLEKIEKNLDLAFKLMLEECAKGNSLALHDIGKMYGSGLGIEIDENKSYEYYEKALKSFESIYKEKFEGKEKTSGYLEYRIGKMYMSGLGTTKDFNEAHSWLSKASEKDHMYAQYSLAGMYYKGEGVEKNFERAFELYKSSSEKLVGKGEKAKTKTNPYAFWELGKMCEKGEGTLLDKIQSQKYFEKAFVGFNNMLSERADDKLLYRIGSMHLNGIGTLKDVVKAKEFFEKAATLKNEHATYQLAMMIIRSENPDQEELNNALSTLKKLSDNGNNNAQYNYGRLLLIGEQLIKNIPEAIKYLEMAAEQKNSFALYKLGTVYLDEESEIKDISKALEYLIRSSELKNSGAFYKLGTLYLDGEVEIDKNKAVEYFKEAIKLENDTAMYKLASLYLNGDIIEKDLVEGIKLLESAIEKENHIAMCKMASLKVEGEVTDKDVDGAVELFKKAVEKESDNAMYQLGKLYFLGKEIKQDKEEGLKYLNMAVLAGNEYAQNFLDYQDWILFNEKLDLAVDLLMIIENRSGGGNDRIRPLTEKSKEEKRAYVKEIGKGGVTYIEHMHEL